MATKGVELLAPVIYIAVCIAPAWAGFRARDGEHAVQRSRALMLSNVVLALVMVLLGLDMLTFPTSFMRVGGREGRVGAMSVFDIGFEGGFAVCHSE